MQVLWLLIRSILMLSLDTEKKLSYYPIRVLKVSNHLTKQRTSILNEDRPKLRTPNFNLDTLIVLSTNTIFFSFYRVTSLIFSFLISLSMIKEGPPIFSQTYSVWIVSMLLTYQHSSMYSYGVIFYASTLESV